MSKSLYTLLGVPPDADTDTIRQAYEQQAAAAQDEMRRVAVKEAWLTLGHPGRRAAYDARQREQRHRELQRHAAATPAEPDRGAGSPLLWLLLGGLVAVGAMWGWRQWSARPAARAAAEVAAPVPGPAAAPPAADPLPLQTAAGPGTALSPEDLFARASASVVRINALQSSQSGVSGSGVVLGPGSVVTNCHVARGGARLRVLHGRESLDATVEMADESHDLCRLSVPGLNAPAALLGRVGNLRVGQKVFAIGSPRGLDLTLSDGLVSSLRESPDGTLIQTSAPISPGSSGGGLFTEDGQLVGIVTFQVRDGQNLNFALPVDWVLRMQPSDRSRGSALPAMRATGPAPDGAPTPRAAAVDSALLGSWQCFGPLTGRGITLVFGADGSLGGQMEGRALNGRFQLRDGQLWLADGSGTQRYLVEELNAARLVMNAGSARRLACSR